MLDISKITGGLLGLAVGDALGWPVEPRGNRVGGTSTITPAWRFEAWTRREGGSYGSHQQEMTPGAVSDDTQLALAVARAVLRGEHWQEYLAHVEIPWWSLYERGGGGATKRAAKSWFSSRRPWADASPDDLRKYHTAGGNGTAMRCLPYAIVAENWDVLVAYLDGDAVLTHGHPRAILGSRVYGWAAWRALRRRGSMRYGELVTDVIEHQREWSQPPILPSGFLENAGHDFEAEWHTTVQEVMRSLAIVEDGIRAGAIVDDFEILEALGAFGPANGAGTVTALSALFLTTRYITQPKQGLMAAAFARGADTDTLAAMTGGLLGFLNGDEWLFPLSEDVQDAYFVRAVAEALATGEDTLSYLASGARSYNAQERTHLYRWLEDAEVGEAADLGPFGVSEITAIEDHGSRQQFVRSWSFDTAIGQSILVKRYDKGRDGRPKWRLLPNAENLSPQVGAPEAVSRSDSGERRPGGIVLYVNDVERSSHFYSTVLGLGEPTKVSGRFVSFGWLALEPDTAKQLRLAAGPISSPAIRVYMDIDTVLALAEALDDQGLPVRVEDLETQVVLHTSDWDGHALELVARV